MLVDLLHVKYYMPRIVKLRLDYIQRNFLWGGGSLEKKPHLVKWAMVCVRKEYGGLGVKDLGGESAFVVERKALWMDLVRVMY